MACNINSLFSTLYNTQNSEDFLKISSLKCLYQTAKVKPVINQNLDMANMKITFKHQL